MCMIFCHEAFSEEVYYVARWVTVTKKVPETDLFGDKECDYARREPGEGNDQIGGEEGYNIRKYVLNKDSEKYTIVQIRNL